ncbi:C69 family dipeptidase [Labrys sp. LIt4]|uniref:C69 family dipeptidase n=1 Tax=Labrys sp. LIt4 TaxID=2821355 RepID=UPI001ADFB8FB|nr:C69 family dipeptidase [Labrys sp. LIt4]
MSYGLYIGRNHTADGVAYLAGYGDEPSSHWLELRPRCRHEADARIPVGVTPQADLPGRMSEIPQVPETARHLRVSYSYYKGVPAPLTNGGLNEHGVAVRDIWSSSRAELVAMTPADQTGPNYSDLACLVLERARSARQGVEIIADLIARHGYADYGGNSHLIADAGEAWVVIEFSGGQGLWVAERLGPDAIRASRPGYVGLVPVEDPARTDFLYPPHFVSFAQEQGWHRPGTPFDANAVYGDAKGRWAGVQWIEAEMAARAARPEKIGLADVFWAVRTERLTGDTAGYGQVVPLLGAVPDALRLIWHTPVGAVAAPFVPVFLGSAAVPEEYRQHRYLSDGEASRFLDSRHAENGRPQTLSAVPQGIESTRSASFAGKRLLNLLFQNHEAFLAEALALWQAIEARLAVEQARITRSAAVLIEAGEPDLAAHLLTYFTDTELQRALDAMEQLAQALEVRTRYLFGFRTEPVPRAPAQLW